MPTDGERSGRATERAGVGEVEARKERVERPAPQSGKKGGEPSRGTISGKEHLEDGE